MSRHSISIFTSLVLVAFLSASVFAAEWTTLDSMNRKRGEFGNTVVDGKIYVFGGIHDHTTGPGQVEMYNPANNTWTDISTMPVVKNHFTTGYTYYKGEIWICGGKLDGKSASGSKRVDVYNVAGNTWRQGPDLPENHWGGPAVIVRGKLHVLSGAIDRTNSTNHHFVLDLENEAAGWSTLKVVPNARVHAAGVPLAGKIWLIGGEYHHAHDGDTRTMQVYDPITNTWDTGKAQIPEARSHHEWATFVHNGKIISVSGVDSSKSPRGQNTMYEYDPETDAWTALPDLPAKLVSPGAKMIDNTLYVYGGGVDDWFGGSMVTTLSYTFPRTQPTFAAPKDISAGTVSGVSCMEAADLNGDGFKDVVVIEGGKHASGRKTFKWFKAPSDPQGTWTGYDINNSAPLDIFLGSAGLADFDNDGDIDLVVSSDKHSGTVKAADVFVFKNPGPGSVTGTWAYHKLNSSTMAKHHINDMDIADLDGDGKLDVICRALVPNQILIFFQDSISSWTKKEIDTNIVNSEGLAVGFLDADNLPDIEYSGFYLKSPSDPRTQNYTKLKIDSNFVNINQNTKESIGDIDGDGLNDVIIGPAEAYRDGGNHHLAWYRNPGTTVNINWEKHVIVKPTNNMHRVKLGDMDDDGDLDAVIGICWSNTVSAVSLSIYYNDGAGNFSPPQIVASGKGLYAGGPWDLEGDGDLDIVGQNKYSNTSKPYIYENLLIDGSAPTNTPPSVKAGIAQSITLPADTVDLNGTVSDADGDALSTFWSKQSGPGTVNFGNPNNVDTTGQFSVSGTYVLKLEANDGTVTASDTVTITVNPEPGLPVDAFTRVEAEDYIDMSGLGIYSGGTGEKIGSIHNGEWAAYLVDFGTGASQFDGSCASDTSGGTIELRLDAPDGTLVGSVTVPGTGSWNNFIDVSCVVTGASGVHTLYLVFTGPTGYLVDVDYFQFSTASVNTPPSVSAGTDQTVTLPSDASLNGTVSDADGDTLTMSWSKQSGPGTVTFGNASAADTAASFSVEGSYVLKLTADDGTDSASDTVTVTVNPEPAVNTPPTVSAGADQAVTLSSDASLNGTVSDVDGDTLTVTWSKQSGPGTVTFGNASNTDTTASFSIDGTYVLKLAVSDGTDTASDTVTITVNSEPVTSALDAFSRIEAEDFDETDGVGIYDGGTGQKIGNTQDGDWVSYLIDFGAGVNQFDASGASKVNGGTVELHLDAPDGTVIGSVDIPDTNSWNDFVDVSCSVSNTSGIRTLYLVFTGPDSYLVDIDYFQFSMTSANTSPTVNAGADQTVTLPSSANLDGSASDADGDTLTVTWAKQAGPGTVTFNDNSSVDTTAAFSVEGSYVLKLSVYDGTVTVSDTVEVTVLSEQIQSDLFAQWTFDEGTGTLAADSSDNGFDAALENGTAWTSGKLGSAGKFDGSNDYADAGVFDLPGSTVTLTAWVKFDSLSGYVGEGRILSKATSTADTGHYFMLSPYPSGGGHGVRFRLKAGGTTATLVGAKGLQTGVWTHVAAVYNGSQMKVFMNGTVTGTLTKTGAITGNSSVPVWIGGNPSGAADRPFDGSIDDVRIYTRAFSDSEIADMAGDPVINTAPFADMVLDVYEGYAPLAISFDGSGSSDTEGDTLSYYWDFGDGTDANGVKVSHSYGAPGQYTASLTVTDEAGLADSVTEIIMVDVNPSDVLSVSLKQPSGYDVSQMFTGTIYYVDRSYTIISMPSFLEGEWGIRTANDDKYISFADHLVFEVNQPVDVYIAYDNRGFNKTPFIPDWMGSFTDTGMTLEVKDGGATPMHIYKAQFGAGTVTLGGNYSGADTGARSNYMVFVLPQGSTLDSQLQKPLGSVVYSKAGTEWWYHEGDSDGDGLTDEFERDKGLDPSLVDTDTDSIMDEDETDEDGNPLYDILNNLTDDLPASDISAGSGCSYDEHNGNSVGLVLLIIALGLGMAIRRK